MKILLLSGYGISLSVDNSMLKVRNGRTYQREPEEYLFKPKQINLDNIVIDGHSGNITLDAMKWLSKMNVQLTIINWDGRSLTNVLIPEQRRSIIRRAQYNAYQNGERLPLAKKFIEAKISNTKAVLDWIGERYPEAIESHSEALQVIDTNAAKLPDAASVREVMGISKGWWPEAIGTSCTAS